MRLIIVHSHYRPGGVRRVIELAAPWLVHALRPRVRSVVLVGGEAPDAPWRERLQASLGTVPLTEAIEPAARYLEEQRGAPVRIARRLRAFLQGVLPGPGAEACVVWAHNQGLGRNLLLTRELTRACSRLGVPLVLHHHDWWFDNRWRRWPEMRRAGFRTLAQVAETLFAASPNVRHVAINQADAAILLRHLPSQSAWIPNLAEPAPPPPTARVRSARRWLEEQFGRRAPVWLLPCRLLRRKNVAEALLLMRWLRPEAWLVTTGGVSSNDEQAYADQLAEAAWHHRWPLRLGILGKNENIKPAIPELLAASEAVLLVSIQEGFGLPYLEAAAAQRPLLARALPNVAPDLAQMGFRFPQYYDEVQVDPRLFNWSAEVQRQSRRFHAWREQLPRAYRRLTGQPVVLATAAAPRPVPFSRLTLTAQLEVLAHAPADSWAACAPLNPFLRLWRSRATQGALQASPWPRTASRWLSGSAYARNFLRSLRPVSATASTTTDIRAVQDEFIRAKLSAENLYPLLWTRVP